MFIFSLFLFSTKQYIHILNGLSLFWIFSLSLFTTIIFSAIQLCYNSTLPLTEELLVEANYLNNGGKSGNNSRWKNPLYLRTRLIELSARMLLDDFLFSPRLRATCFSSFGADNDFVYMSADWFSAESTWHISAVLYSPSGFTCSLTQWYLISTCFYLFCYTGFVSRSCSLLLS